MILPVGIGSEEAAGSYQIERSLRFNSADTAYLNKTFSSTGTGLGRTGTFSFWLKRSSFAEEQFLINWAGASADGMRIYQDTLYGYVQSTGYNYRTVAVFRDPSAWYHIVFQVDTTAATASDRLKIWVNNQRQTLTGSYTSITQNQDVNVLDNVLHVFGKQQNAAGSYLGGYLTEFYGIDGQALEPTSFGEYNEDTGVWQPKAYTGSYGTNGFYLNFSDNSGVTSTTLGADSSGNGNNWTPNNFSVTAGAGNDSLVDTPTNYGTDTGVGGEVRANYCTYNAAGSAPSVTLTNGNLDASHGAFTTTAGAAGTFGVSSGKWYWEVTINSISSGVPFIGIVRADQLYPFTTLFANNSQGYGYRSNGDKRNNSSDTAYGASYTNGDVIGVALDMDAGTIVFYKNNSSQGTAFSSLSGTFIPIDGNGTSGGTYTSTVNFGQRPFAYTAPSGFKALCTQNLPEPTIVDGSQYFDVALWSGTGASQSITGLAFQPDWVWGKIRSGADYHVLTDAVRGNTKFLKSNTTDAEITQTQNITSFNSDGYTIGTSTDLNRSGYTFVGWNWKANGAGVSNTDGTITSTVSANTDSGFSIVTYTGTGSAATVGHGLGVAPSMVIVKNRSAAWGWFVYNRFLTNPNTGRLQLNLTNAEIAGGTPGPWNNTAPTSIVFSIGDSSFPEVNGSGNSLVAYCFAAIPGYSAFGSYTGNGSADGPMIFTGFKPAFVLFKITSGVDSWVIYDSVRNTYNVVNNQLYPNGSGAEYAATSAFFVDFVSNGFKVRATSGLLNGSGSTYIYMAFAENPFKYSLAR